MSRFLSFEFWNTIAGIILRNRIFTLLLITAFTVFLAFQWQHMRFSYTEANLLPDEHEINLQYEEFLDKFGDEGSMIVMAVTDSSLFTPEKFTAWNNLANKLEEHEEIEYSLAIGDLNRL